MGSEMCIRDRVNLWQIAKHLNFGGGIPADLHDAIAEVRAAVEKLAGDE